MRRLTQRRMIAMKGARSSVTAVSRQSCQTSTARSATICSTSRMISVRRLDAPDSAFDAS